MRSESGYITRQFRDSGDTVSDYDHKHRSSSMNRDRNSVRRREATRHHAGKSESLDQTFTDDDGDLENE